MSLPYLRRNDKSGVSAGFTLIGSLITKTIALDFSEGQRKVVGLDNSIKMFV